MAEAPSTAAENGEQRGDATLGPKRRELLQLPGLAAIGLYLAAVAAVIIVGVVGRNYPPLFLVFFCAVLCGEWRPDAAVALGMGTGPGGGSADGFV